MSAGFGDVLLRGCDIILSQGANGFATRDQEAQALYVALENSLRRGRFGNIHRLDDKGERSGVEGRVVIECDGRVPDEPSGNVAHATFLTRLRIFVERVDKRDPRV
jgi:hypothetical protein